MIDANLSRSLQPQRLDGETFEDYKFRRSQFKSVQNRTLPIENLKKDLNGCIVMHKRDEKRCMNKAQKKQLKKYKQAVALSL